MAWNYDLKTSLCGKVSMLCRSTRCDMGGPPFPDDSKKLDISPSVQKCWVVTTRSVYDTEAEADALEKRLLRLGLTVRVEQQTTRTWAREQLIHTEQPNST